MVTLLRWLAGARGAVRPVVLASGGVAASTVAVVIAITAGGGPPPPGTANLWIDSNGGSCTRSAGGAGYVDAAACPTLDSANDACQSGDTVLVKAGAYGAHINNGTNSRTSACTVQAASGETVTLGGLETNGDWLTLKDMTLPQGTTGGAGWQTDWAAGRSNGSHVTLDNVNITGAEASVYINGGTDITWKNSSFGTNGNTTARVCGNGGNGGPIQIENSASHITLRQIDIYQFFPDLSSVRCGGDIEHLEDIRADGAITFLTVDQTRFHNGSGDGSARIFFSGSGASNFTLTNSWVGIADGHDGNRSNGIDFEAMSGTSCGTFVLAYDTIDASINDTGCTPTLPRYYGLQAATGAGCQGSAHGGNLWVSQFDHNGTCAGDTWLVDAAHDCNTGGACKGPYLFAADGYHLTALSPAITQGGESTQCPSITGGVDIDGHARAHLSPCEPGADEFGN